MELKIMNTNLYLDYDNNVDDDDDDGWIISVGDNLPFKLFFLW